MFSFSEREDGGCWYASVFAEMNGNGTATPTVDPRVGKPLTAREEQVLRLIAAGAFTSEIAAQLWVSETTVAYHVRQILAKLEANNRAHAVAIMLRAELPEVEPDGLWS